MTTALMETNGNGVVAKVFDREKIDLIKRTVARDATDDELALFLHQAQRSGLDPLAKQIHAVSRWDKKLGRKVMSIQVAIDGYRLIADRTGLYAGSDDYRFNEGLTQFEHLQTGERAPVTATVTVYKIVAGQRVPFTATVAWDAYYPGQKQGFMWSKMPHLMLGKCAEALALRKAFPAELSGMYVREEMEQAGFTDVESDNDVIDVEPEDDIPVVDQSLFDFAPNDEVMVAGKNDEKPGTVIRLDGALVVVNVNGKEFSVKPERLTLVDVEAEQEPLFPDETAVDGAFTE